MKIRHYLILFLFIIICVILYNGCNDDIRGPLQNTNSFASYVPWWKEETSTLITSKIKLKPRYSNDNLIYPETNNLVDLGNSNICLYATGTPLYVESDPIWYPLTNR